jgi:hypothetical protein
MNEFSIIILRFFMRKFLETKNYFEKISQNFPAADAEIQKNFSRRRRLPQLIGSRNRRVERRRLTPLLIIEKNILFFT